MVLRILVVEDYPATAQLLDDALTYAGFTVVTAANGLDALRQMRRQTPDLVVLDVSMPVMDGFTLARRIQRDPLLSRVPFLFLTASSDMASKIEGFGVGANDYVVKPFELAELMARVGAILRRCRVQDIPEHDVIRVGDCALDLTRAAFQAGGAPVQLTAIESDLLRLLMLSPGVPFTGKQLLVDVLDYPPDAGDPSLVRWHVRNLRLKIESDPAHPVHLLTMSSRGYCFR